jgi:hypothetical protein
VLPTQIAAPASAEGRSSLKNFRDVSALVRRRDAIRRERFLIIGDPAGGDRLVVAPTDLRDRASRND